MNYLMNIHRIPIFLVYLLITTIIILGIAIFLASFLRKITDPLANFLKLAKDTVAFALMFIIFMGLTGINVLTYKSLRNALNDGRVKKVYIVKEGSRQYLTVLFSRKDTGKASTWYNAKIKAYDLLTGKCLGQVFLVKGSFQDDYRIFGPFGQQGWGFSYKSGLHALNLAKPAIIATERELIKQNPQLGKKIKLHQDSFLFNPFNKNLHVRGAKGELLRLAPNLKTYPIAKVPISKMNLRNIEQNRLWSRWQIERTAGTSGRTVHLNKTKLSSQKAILLAPKIIKEWNKVPVVNNKIWVSHYASLEKDSDFLLSYIAADGRELSQINLNKEFDSNQATVLVTLTLGDETLIFASVKRYKLSALRTDSATGKILGRIDYF